MSEEICKVDDKTEDEHIEYLLREAEYNMETEEELNNEVKEDLDKDDDFFSNKACFKKYVNSQT